MQLLGIKSNSITFTNIIPTYPTMEDGKEGMDIYQRVVEKEYSSSFFVVNDLIDMYAKCVTNPYNTSNFYCIIPK